MNIVRGWHLCVAAAVIFALGSVEARAAIDVGSDGSDGALNVTSANLEIDLSLAATGTWTNPSPIAGRGIYDPVQWAVVFKYSSVNIAANRTVTFKNHPTNAPVVWLVQGDVTISGAVSVDGKRGHTTSEAAFQSEPGPGGFRGGRTWLSPSLQEVAGFGPGGGRLGSVVGCLRGFGGSYALSASAAQTGTAGPTYGNNLIMPLIGGSGAAGIELGTCSSFAPFFGSGAGGGAILIGSNQAVVLNGTVSARGGNQGGGDVSGGSGGAIRIVADTVSGTGLLRATGGVSSGIGSVGGAGRIRVDANSITLVDPGNPAYTFGLPGSQAMIFPPACRPRCAA